MSRARELTSKPAYDVAEDDDDDLDESEDDDYNEHDAEAEEQEAAKEDHAEAGSALEKKAKRSRIEVQSSRKSKRRKGDELELAAVDDDELAALREDAIEQFGADVLAEHDDGKSVHTRAAERAELDAIMQGLHSSEDALFARRGRHGAGPTQAAISAAIHLAPALPSALRACVLPPVPHCGVEDGEGEGGGTAGEFIGALNRRAYGPGHGWHTSLGGIQQRPSHRGPLLQRLMTVAPPDVSVLEAQGAVGEGQEGQQDSSGRGRGALPLTGDELERARAIASSALALAGGKKLAVTSTVKFAGQTMTVTKMVTAGTEAAAKAAAEAKDMQDRREIASATAGPVSASAPSSSSSSSAPLGLDAVVSNLDKPEAINTLAKTNMDWEQYKAKEGLDEQFESRAQAQGYVEKQAFLGRVEERAAELAKAKRAEERRQRDLQQR